MKNSSPKQTCGKGQALLKMRGIRIEAFTPGVGWAPIVHGIDLDLARGEVLGLVGESGAGKSMTALAAMAYARDGCRIAAGEIVFDGIDLLAANDTTRRALRGVRISYVAQSAIASFNPAHVLIDQYAEVPVQRGIRRRAEAYADAIALFARMRLSSPNTIGFRYPHQVSGGELQRAMTAMAMATRPDLIIFDEPTTALDVTTQIDVLAAIKNIIQQFSTAALFISHDLAVVAQMADRVMVLRDGHVVEQADTRTILACPQHEYTKSLWSVRNLHKVAPLVPRDGRSCLLSVENVSAAYTRAEVVLKNVSLDIPKSVTIAIVGESGSGKSTMARVITGLLPASSGRITFDGAELPRQLKYRSREQRRHIQMLYQNADTALNPRQSVRQILGRPLKLHFGMAGPNADRRVAELLETVELSPTLANRYPAELSGGQKRRIGIAMALATEPRLIICDEITSGLDQLVAERIIELLLSRQQQFGLSYLFITHDFGTVDAIADEVIVMLHGEIVERASKSTIMTVPEHPYTKMLLSSIPRMDPDWLDRVLTQRRAQGVDFGSQMEVVSEAVEDDLRIASARTRSIS